MTLHRPWSDPRRAARWRVALTLVGAVLVVHGLLLASLPEGAGQRWRGDERRSVQLRRIVAMPTAAPAPRPPPLARPEPAPKMAAPAAPESPSAAAPVVEAPAASPQPEGTALPTYATRAAPAATLQYALSRGGLQGSAELGWQPGADGYEAALDAQLASIPLLRFTSRGAFDANGLAPERFVDRRARRGAQAANFRRDEGRITFSGAATEVPLAAGAQDRLTWMLQLAAIVDAEPARFGPGSRVVMSVVGARGDADVWTFEVEAVEPLELPAGRIEAALRLQRAPTRPYDLRAEVWLDPTRHHLPVKVRLVATGSGEATVFELAGFVLR